MRSSRPPQRRELRRGGGAVPDRTSSAGCTRLLAPLSSIRVTPPSSLMFALMPHRQKNFFACSEEHPW
eukprot:4882825-Prymnesium_polylepis.1